MYVPKTVGVKGQIVIPGSIRRIFGLRPGSEVAFDVEDGKIVILPRVDSEKFVEDFCSVVKKKLGKRVDLEKLYEEELAERMR